jgi:hypothetical protein
MKYLLVVVGALAVGFGCQKGAPQAAAPQFIPAQPKPAESPIHASAAPAAPPKSVPQVMPVVSLSPSPSAPASLAATRPAGQSSGLYMIVGTVVAEANGHPIYAEKVLAKIDPELSTKAPQLEPTEFRKLAENLIRQEIRYEVSLELELAAAQRNTTEEDQQQASGLTMVWKQREIIKAGGAPAVARRMALENDGVDFEEKVRDQYRQYLMAMFYHRHLWSQVQVSADDMRAYYNRNLEELFTEKAAVRFRAIKVSIEKTGTPEAAARKMQDIAEKAKRGEDFAGLARASNDDRNWAKNSGFMQMSDVKKEDGQIVKEPTWYQKGSLKLEELEKAVFALNVGDVTDIIKTGDAFYIAKLEEKQKGRVQAFEEQRVQDIIRDTLTRGQRGALRAKVLAKLEKAAVVRVDEKQIQTATDMAMQKYAMWTRPNGVSRAGQE